MKTKTLVGRIFTLTNHKNMSWDAQTNGEWHILRKIFGTTVNKEKIGHAVVIYDESSRKVKVGTKTGHMIWISKHYLKESGEQSIKSPKGKLETIITTLVDISNKTNDTNTATQINTLLIEIRSVMDYIEYIDKINK